MATKSGRPHTLSILNEDDVAWALEKGEQTGRGWQTICRSAITRARFEDLAGPAAPSPANGSGKYVHTSCYDELKVKFKGRRLPNATLFTAKHNSPCAACGGQLAIGDEIIATNTKEWKT